MSSTSLMAKQTRIITEHLPSAPFPAVPCTKTPSSNSVAISGDTGTGAGSAIETTTLYQLSFNADRLLIWDVTNPAAMNKVGDQTLNSGAFATNQKGTSAIGVLSKKAYIVNYDGVANCFLGVYDCTVPGAITQSGTFLLAAGTSNQGPRRVALSVVGADTFAFVAFNDVINILKVTNPAAITSVATVTVPDVAGNGAQGVFVFNNVLYATTNGLLSGDFRAKAWNVATPSAPVLKWDTAIVDVNAFTLPDIYAVNQNGSPVAVVLVQELGGGSHGQLQILNGTTGAVLGTLQFTTNAIAVDAQVWVDPTGGCAEVVFAGASALKLVNVGNPAAPALIPAGTVSLGGQFNSVAGLSSGTPTSVFVSGIVGGGNFSLRVNSVNV